MRRFHRSMIGSVVSLLGLSILVTRAWAQTAGPAPSPVAPGSSGGVGAAGGMVVGAVLLGLLLVIGVAIKLYDMKRKREEEGVAVQGALSDALLVERSLAGLTITPTVQVPFRRSMPANVTVRGLVPAPAHRDATLQLVTREIARSRMRFRIEDRIVVDPLMRSKRAA